MKSKTNGFVVGGTGGIDSAVTSTLCAETGLPVLCLDLPIIQKKNEHNRATKHIKWLEKKYPNVSFKSIDLSKTFSSFKDFSNISKNILKVFQNLEIIFPDFTRPKVITLNSQSEYENRIIYADSLLLVSLDSYLGYDFYPDLPDYISLNMSKEYIVNDISEQIVQKFIKKPNDRTLLGEMIYYGKILYFNKYLTPFNNDYLIFHSSVSKIKWAEENEYNIWAYFVENDLLFDTRNDLKSRFISFAPFSKFNLEIDQKSPGSIGRWIGYKIVNSYMKFNNVDINDLLNEDYYQIYINSKYKPKK